MAFCVRPRVNDVDDVNGLNSKEEEYLVQEAVAFKKLHREVAREYDIYQHDIEAANAKDDIVEEAKL